MLTPETRALLESRWHAKAQGFTLQATRNVHLNRTLKGITMSSNNGPHSVFHRIARALPIIGPYLQYRDLRNNALNGAYVHLASVVQLADAAAEAYLLNDFVTARSLMDQRIEAQNGSNTTRSLFLLNRASRVQIPLGGDSSYTLIDLYLEIQEEFSLWRQQWSNSGFSDQQDSTTEDRALQTRLLIESFDRRLGPDYSAVFTSLGV